jgi:hypothetical protein
MKKPKKTAEERKIDEGKSDTWGKLWCKTNKRSEELHRDKKFDMRKAFKCSNAALVEDREVLKFLKP